MILFEIPRDHIQAFLPDYGMADIPDQIQDLRLNWVIKLLGNTACSGRESVPFLLQNACDPQDDTPATIFIEKYMKTPDVNPFELVQFAMIYFDVADKHDAIMKGWTYHVIEHCLRRLHRDMPVLSRLARWPFDTRNQTAYLSAKIAMVADAAKRGICYTNLKGQFTRHGLKARSQKLKDVGLPLLAHIETFLQDRTVTSVARGRYASNTGIALHNYLLATYHHSALADDEDWYYDTFIAPLLARERLLQLIKPFHA